MAKQSKVKAATAPNNNHKQQRLKQSSSLRIQVAAAIIAAVAVFFTFSGGFSSSVASGSTRTAYTGFQPSTVALLASMESVPLYLQTHVPSEIADTLAILSAELYEYCLSNEDVLEPSQVRADEDVQKLVIVTRALQQRATELLRPALDPTKPSIVYWKLMCALLFSEAVAFADYYQLLDDEPLQAASLLNATNTILYVTKEPRVLRNLMDLSDKDVLLREKLVPTHESYKQFIHASAMSAEQLHRRRAALFEMLVVLYPDYAPLRLWYGMGLVLDMQRGSDASTQDFLTREYNIAAGKQHNVARIGVSTRFAEVMNFLRSFGLIRSTAAVDDQSRVSIVEGVLELAAAWTLGASASSTSCEELIADSIGITDEGGLKQWSKKFGWVGEVHAAPPLPSLLLTQADMERFSGVVVGAMVSWQSQGKIGRDALNVLKDSCIGASSLR